MNKFTIFLLLVLSFAVSNQIDIPKAKHSTPEDIKAYGTINFGDGKQYVKTKLKENEIYRNVDMNAYTIHLFDTPFIIEFVYGTNDRKPTFLKTIRLKLGSIVDSHIITRIIEAFDTQFGTSEKYYIDIEGDIKEYYRWEKEDKVAHLDFDGMNIDITINSIHFNKLSKSYIDKDVEDSYKKKAERMENQLKKLF